MASSSVPMAQYALSLTHRIFDLRISNPAIQSSLFNLTYKVCLKFRDSLDKKNLKSLTPIIRRKNRHQTSFVFIFWYCEDGQDDVGRNIFMIVSFLQAQQLLSHFRSQREGATKKGNSWGMKFFGWPFLRDPYNIFFYIYSKTLLLYPFWLVMIIQNCSMELNCRLRLYALVHMFLVECWVGCLAQNSFAQLVIWVGSYVSNDLVVIVL